MIGPNVFLRIDLKTSEEHLTNSPIRLRTARIRVETMKSAHSALNASMPTPPMRGYIIPLSTKLIHAMYIFCLLNIKTLYSNKVTKTKRKFVKEGPYVHSFMTNTRKGTHS